MKEMVGGCCVCSDDRGWSENPLVYCDGQSCAVAVHQACYGIVTVPSGPWYCRKCESQERSARVRCELCPSRDGALKRTDNLGWAHVVCALYIPEVRFGNVTTMEPIILQLIPQERYNKTCYICQEMGKGSRSTAGACMQCNKSGCKQQFHVTCAQQLGLLCEEAGNYLDNVKYCGYCQHHYSKLKKGGNVKTIPPYKPISHETNSSDGPSSPEKELDPAPTQPHPGGSNMSVSGNSGMKSNNRIPEPPGSTSSATSSSSKQRKSSSASKSSGNAISTSASSTSSIVSSVSGNINMVSQSGNPVGTAGISSVTSGTPSNSILGGVPTGKTSSSSSSSSSNKDKDKYSKNVNKVSSTNKSHDKEPSSSTSSSSSSQRDKSSKSSKSSGVIGSTGSSSSTPGLVSSVSNTTGSSSILAGSLPKDLDFATLAAANASAPPMPSSLVKQQDIATSRPEKTLAQISSAAATTARTASLSPADIPTTLIIKPPHDHTGNNKDLLSKEAIAKFTTSNFTETIVVNSDSVFGNTNTASNNPGIGAATVGASGAAPANVPSNTGSTVGPTSVIETGMGNPVNKLNAAGGVSSFPSTGSSIAKKRKADARSTPTSLSNLDIDINRDLIKDVAVSLVPLPLNKSDNIDPAALSGIEKNIKKIKCPARVVKRKEKKPRKKGRNNSKAKTEPSSPHNPTGDPNIQNVSPNLIQSHTSNIVSSAIKHQQQPNSPQLQQHQQSPQQQQQQQGQQHTPSLVVSVPLSTATVPGVNLPANNSGGGGGGSSSASSTSASNNAPNSSSGNTSTIVSPGQMPSGSSLYQQLTQRTSDQIMNVAANRASPVIQQQSSSASSSHVIQNPAHSILERQSPSMRLSPAIISSAGSQHLLGPQTQHTFSGGGLELIASSTISSNVSVLQSVSPVPMSAIQSTSSSPIIPGGGDGGLKISFEKQVSVSRITALQEEDLTGRRSRTPDNSFGSSSSFSTGGLKFSYEAQPGTNPTTIGATSTIITPQPMVKESPPSSPGSDSGMARGSKRNRKLSTNSNAALGAPDAKESKLFQNGVVHATHMLGNQLNPNSSVAQKMSDQLSMELEAHSFVEAAPQIVGPPFPGKSQAARSNASAPVTSGPSLSSMLAGGGTATANGNTPQSLEQLLERQWEQGSQFLMEQAQHFDIASLLSCLHQLRSENIRLEEHVNNLVARRDHLLAVNARLAIPLNPTAMGGIGIVGGGGSGSSGGGGAGPGSAGGPGSTGGSGLGATGSQGQFNNMHGNGPHDSAGSNLSNPSVTSRSSRIQQHQSQQQQSQSLFSSNTSNQIPLENGIDFRHSNSSHQNTSSSSIRHHSPSNQSCPPPSNSSSRQPSSSSSSAISSEQPAQHSRSNRGVNSSSANNSLSAAGASGGNNPPSSSAYQAQQQTIYNTAHQIPLLLEHHQQEHHSQQQLQSQAQPQPAHHLRQTPPTVSSRSHQSHSARAAGGNPSSSSHSHHPGPLSHHHQALSSAPSSHAQPPPSQQQPLPQRQRH
ncbi:protein AF-10 isoform X6 [Armigeres subalbatus]|uniref:protein AF-10 isoform X6 n=1 Tax=Armigeres subalbatus TaxID=124917 RepID=UPI002ED54E72